MLHKTKQNHHIETWLTSLTHFNFGWCIKSQYTTHSWLTENREQRLSIIADRKSCQIWTKLRLNFSYHIRTIDMKIRPLCVSYINIYIYRYIREIFDSMWRIWYLDAPINHPQKKKLKYFVYALLHYLKDWYMVQYIILEFYM